MSHFIIAIDGPAASGKGTLAQKISKHYQISYLDTGLSYRALAYQAFLKKINLDNKKALIRMANDVDLENLDPEILSQHEIGQMASKIAVFSEIRQTLVKKQRFFAKKSGKIVLDGRDIGTVVYPDANAKIFITADVSIRARRRFEQLIVKNNTSNIHYEQILLDLEQRDLRDKTRKDGPLIPAPDAYLLDTSKMSIDEMFQHSIAFIDPIWKKR